MWTRSELKTKAKQVLRGSYWKAFLVSLLLTIIAGGAGGGSSLNFKFNGGGGKSIHFDSGHFPVFLIVLFIVVGILILLGAIGFRIFVGYPLQVGGRRYFVQSAQTDGNMNELGFAFGKNKYLAVIRAMLWRDVLNFLWFLALIIPGIVKSYAYRMVPYILADNPNIGRKRAVELSIRMTKGHKFKIWVLDLSFIGWYLLGFIAFLVGTLFVIPYVNATNAELYLALRQKALDEGFTTYEELLLSPPIVEL